MIYMYRIRKVRIRRRRKMKWNTIRNIRFFKRHTAREEFVTATLAFLGFITFCAIIASMI